MSRELHMLGQRINTVSDGNSRKVARTAADLVRSTNNKSALDLNIDSVRQRQYGN
jgi:hypothetical protein